MRSDLLFTTGKQKNRLGAIAARSNQCCADGSIKVVYPKGVGCNGYCLGVLHSLSIKNINTDLNNKFIRKLAQCS